jgi:hypothetical protein
LLLQQIPSTHLLFSLLQQIVSPELFWHTSVLVGQQTPFIHEPSQQLPFSSKQLLSQHTPSIQKFLSQHVGFPFTIQTLLQQIPSMHSCVALLQHMFTSGCNGSLHVFLHVFLFWLKIEVFVYKNNIDKRSIAIAILTYLFIYYNKLN